MPSTKTAILAQIKNDLFGGQRYVIAEMNETKPWGAYYRLADISTEQFLNDYFPDLIKNNLGASLSPKFLVFAPGMRISLQYHLRRSERWKVVTGRLRVRNGEKDEWSVCNPGDYLFFDVGEKHRAAGLEGDAWCIVAEIWQHVDASNPSDESDIIRIADDFNRSQL